MCKVLFRVIVDLLSPVLSPESVLLVMMSMLIQHSSLFMLPSRAFGVPRCPECCSVLRGILCVSRALRALVV